MFIMKQSYQDFDDEYDYVTLMTLHKRELPVPSMDPTKCITKEVKRKLKSLFSM
jgi:hypothetical protein